jgi:L-serine dehydratase
MKPISIFNDVLGPIMRGPSSSHTAGPFHIGLLARALLGEEPASVTIAFDPGGSFAEVYRQQGSDLGFAAGLLGIPMTSEEFSKVLILAVEQGVQIDFLIEPLSNGDHPNTVEIRMCTHTGTRLNLTARSIGGGAIMLTKIDNWQVKLAGDAYDLLVVSASDAEPQVTSIATEDGQALDTLGRQMHGAQVLVHSRRRSPLDNESLSRMKAVPGVYDVRCVPPIFFIPCGKPIFDSAAEMVALAKERYGSLGRVALAHESTLMDLPERKVLAEARYRLSVMEKAMHRGLEDKPPQMALLQPSAFWIGQAETRGSLPVGGIHTRAAAGAMAVMHVNSGKGVVCAAPTAGSAGVIPGALLTLAREKGLSQEQTVLALFAASAIGLAVAARATFSAEVAGCQAEIGVAGAMAAAGVVEAAGGSARQATDAAAISLQNTMGSICDPVQGLVEIPCHTRNAVAASSAFVCADIILGGYSNPIPLDETIDGMYAVGKMLPRELKCTALGGLSQTPTALKMRVRSH